MLKLKKNLTWCGAACLLAAVSAFFPILQDGAPPTAQAAIITPGLTTGVGYDDNVRLRQNPRSDFFLTATPHVTLEMGEPSNHFIARAQATYNHYMRLTEYTQWESGRLYTGYHHAFSPAWSMDLSNYFVTSYSVADTDQNTGALVRVRDADTRTTSNTTSIRLNHEIGPQSQVYGGYAFTYNENSTSGSDGTVVGDLGEKSYYHVVDAGLDYLLTPRFLSKSTARASYQDYETTGDLRRFLLDTSLNWLMTRATSYYLALNGEVSRSEKGQVDLGDRDYEIYGFLLGINQELAANFTYFASIGYSYVNGDETSNPGAGKGYPMFNAGLNYTARNWDAEGHLRSNLGTYDFLGENSGLTLTRSVGASWGWRMARHWSTRVFGDYILDDFQQERVTADQTLAPQGKVETYQAGGLLSWNFLEDMRLSLDYRYIRRDDHEVDANDREQNRVLLLLDAEWPYRW